MKIVINTCYGGFSLSPEAEQLYKERKGITDPNWYYWDVERNDPVLVQIVEEMGSAAEGSYAELTIVDIPEDVEWTVQEYDGNEWVAEKHRTWR